MKNAQSMIVISCAALAALVAGCAGTASAPSPALGDAMVASLEGPVAVASNPADPAGIHDLVQTSFNAIHDTSDETTLGATAAP